MPGRLWVRWGAVLGLALGGFFDGILLHQILQWHHLLSRVDGVDLRAQLLWDGYFHALMYLLAVLALAGLWRARTGSGRALLAAMLVGFGLWHVVDAVLSHWLLGIHRIRVDSAAPLAWDLGWLAVFGLVPLIVGWRLGRGPRPPGPWTPALAVATLLTGAAALAASRPPPGESLTTIVFAPARSAAQNVAAVRAAQGRIAWASPDMGVLVVAVAPEHRFGLYRAGALMVSGAALPGGCLDWSAGPAGRLPRPLGAL